MLLPAATLPARLTTWGTSVSSWVRNAFALRCRSCVALTWRYKSHESGRYTSVASSKERCSAIRCRSRTSSSEREGARCAQSTPFLAGKPHKPRKPSIGGLLGIHRRALLSFSLASVLCDDANFRQWCTRCQEQFDQTHQDGQLPHTRKFSYCLGVYGSLF